MSDEVRIQIEPNRQLRIHKIRDVTKLTREEIDNFVDTVARAYKKPVEKDLQAIRKYLRDYPEMCRAVFSLVDSTQDLMVKKMIGDVEPAAIAIQEYLISMRDEMGYHEAPIMEKLLIENIVTSWLRVNWIESQLAMFMNRQARFAELEFWEHRLSMAQRRYLAGCESLAKIRKMKIPALQLNLGDKQIN